MSSGCPHVHVPVTTGQYSTYTVLQWHGGSINPNCTNELNCEKLFITIIYNKHELYLFCEHFFHTKKWRHLVSDAAITSNLVLIAKSIRFEPVAKEDRRASANLVLPRLVFFCEHCVTDIDDCLFIGTGLLYMYNFIGHSTCLCIVLHYLPGTGEVINTCNCPVMTPRPPPPCHSLTSPFYELYIYSPRVPFPLSPPHVPRVNTVHLCVASWRVRSLPISEAPQSPLFDFCVNCFNPEWDAALTLLQCRRVFVRSIFGLPCELRMEFKYAASQAWYVWFNCCRSDEAGHKLDPYTYEL